METPFSIDEALKKQLQLLSERSHDEAISVADLCSLAHAMAELIQTFR